MKKLIVVAVAVFSLSGCVVNTPAPATQVTAVASAPADVWCTSSAVENGVERDLGVAFVRDYGNRFTIINRAGVVTIVSPNLPYVKASSAIGYDKLGLMYSKGLNKYAGFYGVFRTAGKGQQSITFDCR